MARPSFSRVLTPRSIADGPTLTAAAAASCIPVASKFTLPTCYFELGTTWRLRASGRISSVITTPGTARFDLRIGAVVAWDSLAILLDTVAGHTTMPWVLDVLLTCRSIGNSTLTTLIGQGTWACEDILGTPATSPKGGIVAMVPWNTAPAVGTGFDNTAATNTVDLFFTQTAATGSMTVHQYAIEELA
jgi:hypothetical protein